MKMKYSFFMAMLIVMIMTFIASLPAQAEGFYAGVGGSWTVENYDTQSGNSVDNAFGADVKLGYHINEQFALETNFNWVPNIDIDIMGFSGEARINTYMLSLKYSPDLFDDVKPFIIAGTGAMYFKYGLDGYPGHISDHDWCAKVGVGVDYYLTKNFSTGVEVDYIWGFGDLDDVEYMNVIAGVAYHF